METNFNKRAFNYFNSNFRLYQSTRGWFRFNFPLDTNHNDLSGGVNFIFGYVIDHRCGYKASIINFIKEYESVNYKLAKDILLNYSEAKIDVVDYDFSIKTSKSCIKLPKGYQTILEGRGTLAKRAVKVLSSRGFDVELLDSKGFGYVSEGNSEWFGYIIIPFKKEGKLNYYIGRDFIGNYIKYKNPKSAEVGIGKSELLFNEDCLAIYDKIYITEGWADALTMGDNSIATLGWDYSKYQIDAIIKSNCKEVHIIPDKGIVERTELTYYQFAKKTALKLISNKKVKILNTEKFNGKDANEIGRKPIIEGFKETPYFSYANIISS